MGLFSRLLGDGRKLVSQSSAQQISDSPDRASSALVPGSASAGAGDSSGVRLVVSWEVPSLQKVAGSTTFCRPDAQLIALVLLREHDGYLVDVAVVERIAADEDRPEALDVTYQGHRIGALASYVTTRVNLPFGMEVRVPVQLCAADTVKGPRLDAWVWLGGGVPRWDYSEDHRPPVTAKERSREANEDIRAIVSQAHAEGGQRRADFLAGSIGGIHYLETAEPIKQLKREGQLEPALKLCYIGIAGAERDVRFEAPAPWYTIQAAIIHRKLKQRDEEIAVLRRWLEHCPAEPRAGSKVQQRLSKLVAITASTHGDEPRPGESLHHS